MEKEVFTISNKPKEVIIGRILGGCLLIAATVQDDNGCVEDITYMLAPEETNKLFSVISHNEFISLCEKDHLDGMENFFSEKNIKAAKTQYSFPHNEDRFSIGRTFRWTFYEYESEFDGNDFEYTYSFNEENTRKLRLLMFADGKYSSIEEWMSANVSDQETGSDFLHFCKQHDIHGVRKVYEDYPGGIYYKKEF